MIQPQPAALPDEFLPSTAREWDMVRASLLIEHGWTCDYCGVALGWKGSSIDHMIPRCQDGTDHYVNLTICCVRCNSSKGGRARCDWQGHPRLVAVAGGAR